MPLCLTGSAATAVVLVHGIWMTSLELLWLSHRLRRCGLCPLHFRYPSLRSPPAANAERLHRFTAALGAECVHFVGHSLGGIVLLYLFEHFPAQPPGRVVLLGTPAQGSGVARRLARHPATRWLIGRGGAAGLLGGAPAWSADRDLGVIAGTRGVGIGRLLGGLTGPSDGTVALAETRVAGARAELRVDASHIGLVFNPRVAAATCRFLQHGDFQIPL
jgi:pimeloyl-ACP methyl ester carboxylesterase